MNIALHPSLTRLGLVLLLLVMAAAAHPAQRHALLVGVDRYQNVGPGLENLAGAANDVRVLAPILKEHWGFATVTTLTDAAATRQAVLAALDAWVDKAAQGDHLLFYFSGHGTSPNNPEGGLPLPHTTGALFAHDSRIAGSPEAIIDSLIVGRRDLRPRFAALDRKGVYLTAVIDACFSENATRTLRGTSRQARLPALDFGDFGAGSVAYEPYPYQRVVTLAASAANQAALEIDARTIDRYPTFNGQFHGAFSDAVLRALRDRALPDYGPLDKNQDGAISVDEFFLGVRSFMQQRQYDHTPKLHVKEGAGQGEKALFYMGRGGSAAAPTPTAPPPGAAASSQPAPLRVAFTGPASERQRLGALPGIEAVTDRPDLRVSPDGSGYVLADAAGLQIGRADGFPRLQEYLRRRASLDQALGRARLRGTATVGLDISVDGVGNRLPLGTAAHAVQVPLTLRGDRPGYPLVLDLFGDGTVQRLYPDRPGEERPWPAGRINQVLCVKTTPPAGVDTVYAFWLNQPVPADVLAATAKIAPDDGGRFDALIGELRAARSVLGADRLVLEIYSPQAGELAAWPPRCR